MNFKSEGEQQINLVRKEREDREIGPTIGGVEMRRDCKKCSKWEKHFYWSHLDHTKIRFCKKMDASSFMKKMDLPNDFRRNFKGRIGEDVELKGPSGNMWRVGVIKSAEKFTFQSGWKDFVIANSVEANDLLVFKYSSSSSFQVQIFDPSGCEKTSSFFAGLEEIEVRQSSDSSVEVFDGPDCDVHKITISGSSSDSEPVKIPGGRASGPGISKESNGRGKFKTGTNVQITFLERLFMSPAQKQRVLQLSEEIQPENYCFAIFMTLNKIVVQKKLEIPAKFASKHLPRHAKRTILHYKGRAYSLSLDYSFSGSGLRTYFSAGWMEFAKDNSIEEGDLCVFELVMINKDTVSFKVHISRN